MSTYKQEALPTEYLSLSDETLNRRIQEHKEKLGSLLVILGHHYQQDAVIRFADFRGDSLKLSQLAAQQHQAKYIVFCGVHFMAETADILAKPEQTVILPDLAAGCSMADMAELAQVEECCEFLTKRYNKEVLPITYVNSTAEIKSFCGRMGGMTCTSSNAEKILAWALKQNKIILFLPDEHLGRNTALKLGLSEANLQLWIRENPRTDLPDEAPKIVLWNGYCSVHQRFTPEQVYACRERYPEVQVIVHPECDNSVVRLADLNGSTEFIIRTVNNAPAGSVWAVGTELNLVQRLANENPDKKVFSLNQTVCLCTTMNRIDRPHLLWTLDNLAQGRVVNQITVDSPIKEQAALALDRMLSLS